MSELKPYQSCIKVKGINLLPPIITDTRRRELQKDKYQAIKLEKRLKLCRDLKKSLEELIALHSLANTANSSENKIIDSGISPSTNSILPKIKLSRDIIDITEYNNDGIRLININKDLPTGARPGQREYVEGQQLLLNSCSSDAYDTDSSLNRSTEVAVSSVQSSARDQLSNLSNGSSKRSLVHPSQPFTSSETSKKSKPSRASKSSKILKSPTSPPRRLIRSNSYTLEAPSPILLAHLKKCNTGISPNIQQLNPTLSRTWTSLENNFVPLEESEFSSINTVFNTNAACNEHSSEIHLNKLDNEEKSLPKEVEQKSPTIEVVQTDISVQQILVNANSDEVEKVKSSFNLSDPECQLIQVLKKIPEDYSRQIMEIIERQRSEHQIKVDNFEKKFSNPVNDNSTQKKDDNSIDNFNLSEVSNWSNYYTPSDTVSQYGHSDKMIEIDTCDEVSPYQESTNKSHEKSDNTFLPEENDDKLCERVSGSKIPEKDWSNVNINKPTFITDFDSSDDTISIKEKKPRFSRKLFLKNSDNTKKKWAANLICAHVKGYLTRRLLKTLRVQSLIDTIRDALICALELHKAEHIDEADVELHRRLINQVSAACYAFHDIFFSISIPEQMAIISADRKRLREKSRRPSSAPDIRRSMSNSSRSATKSFHSQSHTLMKI
ncbi:uncharacterized protein DDB_G0280205 [Diorhabda carinulata]|uniref:uncharacterized protein DDB_G0280205 n=1 Tax=Diorhabda carinulata TaxID=1163345 RepID=UPI0025A0AAE7|nr:uncharacterized protein DDB_G0280205 [Diorhabda carinulata]